MNFDISAWMVTAAASLICFAAVTLIAQRHFVSRGPVPLGTLVIVLLAFASVAVFLWSIWHEPRDTLAPILLYAASFALFIWTIRTTATKAFLPSFSDAVPQALTVEGPYRYVRHPFYVSYLLYHLGNAAATTAWLPWVMFAAMVVVYVSAALNEERYLAKGSYAAAYDAYKRRTGMFLPRLLPAKQ